MPGSGSSSKSPATLSLQARIIIMDEPTSSLTQRETDRLFAVVADLKKAGVAVVYISHRLAEIQRIADRVLVLRDGRNAGELRRAEISHTALVRLMVGRELQQFYQRKHQAPVAKVSRLEVQDLVYHGGPLVPVSFAVQPGEIAGLAGLVGAGRTELAEALFGIRRTTSGSVLLDGSPVTIRLPSQAVAAGLLLVPEDRRVNGLVLELGVRDNLGLPNLDRLQVLRLIARRRETALAASMVDKLSIRTPSLRQTRRACSSGGNQQKVVLGKWLSQPPRRVDSR